MKLKLLFQRVMGILIIAFTLFLKAFDTNPRNPEFIWFLIIIGLIFLLMPRNMFE